MKTKPHVTVANRIAKELGATHTHNDYWSGSYYLDLDELQIRVSDHSDKGRGGWSEKRAHGLNCVDPYHSQSDVSVVTRGEPRIEYASDDVPQFVIDVIESELVALKNRRESAKKSAMTRRINREKKSGNSTIKWHLFVKQAVIDSGLEFIRFEIRFDRVNGNDPGWPIVDVPEGTPFRKNLATEASQKLQAIISDCFAKRGEKKQ